MNSRGERALARLQRRDAPKFFIVNRSGQVEFSSPNLVNSKLLGASLAHLRERKLAGAFREPAYEELGAGLMLRVVPLTGELDGYVAAFLEDIGARSNSLALASKRFKLTNRESEVLGFILKGYSSPRIAADLFISEGTVGDHVKNILRKAGTKSRSELLVRVLDRETDHSGDA